MNRSQQPALTALRLGMIGLGILALAYGDFAMVWQPVAPWIPGRTVLAYASGLIMFFGGIGCFFSHGGVVGACSVPISLRLAAAESACSGRGAADGSGLARLWSACGAYCGRMGPVCAAGGS